MIDRNLAVINEMKRVLSGEVIVEKGKKPVKPQDLVRLFENIIQVSRSRAAKVERPDVIFLPPTRT